MRELERKMQQFYIKVLHFGYADAGWEVLAGLPVTFPEYKKL